MVTQYLLGHKGRQEVDPGRWVVVIRHQAETVNMDLARNDSKALESSLY